MSNYESFRLVPIRVQLCILKDVLRCILHTILFNRHIDLVTPRETIVPYCDMIYVQCDEEIAKNINSNVDMFYKFIQRNKSGILTLTFYTERKIPGLLNNSNIEMPWELWSIPIIVDKKCYDIDLNKIVINITEQMLRKVEHIPPLSGCKFKIQWQDTCDKWSILDFMKQIIKSPPG